jgi:hypothetical protein
MGTDGPPRAVKVGTIVWALLIGGAAVVFVGSALTPSTKSARFSDERLRQMRADADAAAAGREAATTTAAAAEAETDAAAVMHSTKRAAIPHEVVERIVAGPTSEPAAVVPAPTTKP